MPGSGGMFGGGGGGFFSSLLGGIGGAMAGNWLYDRFFGGNSHSGDNWNSASADAPPSDVGSDFASSGGDVFDNSSSASSDSDSGGGDFGGGGDA